MKVIHWLTLLLLSLPAFAQLAAPQLVNCDVNTPCVNGGPAGTGRGDTAALAFSKINADFTPATASYVSTGNVVANSCPGGPAPKVASGCQAIGWEGKLSGSSSTTRIAPVLIRIDGDTFVNTTPGNTIVVAEDIEHVFGGTTNGATATGTFGGLFVNLNGVASTNNFSAGINPSYAVAGFQGQVSMNEGGTAITPNGALFGSNPNVQLKSGATFWQQLIGEEIDVSAASGSSVADKMGLQIVQTGSDAVQGTRYVGAISINSKPAVTGWNFGLTFGNYDGNWPMTSTGTLIGCYPHATAPPATGVGCGTTAYGIDFAGLGTGGKITFTGAPFTSNGYQVDGSGNTTVNTALMPKITATAAAPGAGLLQMEVVAGTNAGSCKIIAYAGTSATPVTIVDNVGSGC